MIKEHARTGDVLIIPRSRNDPAQPKKRHALFKKLVDHLYGHRSTMAKLESTRSPTGARARSLKLALSLAILGLLTLPAAANSSAERGKVLAAQGDCAICHTDPGALSPPYAGGYELHAYFGTVVSTNITPDLQTGIGRWTANEFYKALHDGVGAGGYHPYPAFPYPYFTKLSRRDADDIFAYLKTVKPVHNTPPPSRLIFPANMRFGMFF
jgi:mono/diheme cytochrome c family protein